MSRKAEAVIKTAESFALHMSESMEGNDGQQTNDAYDERIEVVEQDVEESKEQMASPDPYDVKHLILDALVPPYNPVFFQGFEPSVFYTCKECGDKFVIESSYNFHMERQSMHIKYECDQCFTQITAFNKCSLLLHLRTHSDDPRSIINWSKLSLVPVAEDSNYSLNIDSRQQELDAPTDIQKNATETVHTEVKHCTECNAEMYGSGREHFQGSTGNVSVDQNIKCKYCHMVLPTTCSLKAHERCHRKERPFVCPDCSKIFGLWASFCVHLYYCCFHLDKCVRYRCPACKIFIATPVALEVHILTLHVKKIFKCNACPVACFNVRTMEEHKIKGHARPDLPTNAYQQCQLCPDRLIPKSQLLLHVRDHVRIPSVCVYGYQCNACEAFCQWKADFAAHRANCSEQPTRPADGRMFMLKMQNTVVEPAAIAINQPSTSGASVLRSPGERQLVLKRENAAGKNLNKSPIAQVKTTGPQEIYECNRTLNGSNHTINSRTGVEGNTANAGSLHQIVCLCETCGREYIGLPTDNTDFSLQCLSCENEKQRLSKTKAKKTETAQANNTKNKGNSIKSNIDTKNNENNTKNSVNNSTDSINSMNRDMLPLKRSKSKGIENGINNKRMKIETQEKYKCHICNSVIGQEWEMIKNHFTKEHKNFGLLVLHPKLKGVGTGNKKLAPNTTMRSVSSKIKLGTVLSVDNETKNDSQEMINTTVEEADPNNPRTKIEKHVENKSVKRKSHKVKLGVDTKPDNGVQNSGRTQRSKKTPVPKNKLPSPPSPSTNCGQLIWTHKKNTNGMYVCFKCQYRDHDEQSFWSHIITHKTVSQAYQCMECGMCFVVKPSFQKHLFISHRIRDVDLYIQSHELCHQKPKKDLQSELEDTSSQNGGEVEENQCKVCKEKFQSSIHLEKHFRTHGMAFLMMKQANRKSLNDAKTNEV